MKKFLALLLVAVLVSPMAYAQLAAEESASTTGTASEEVTPAKKYFCPMDGFMSDKPGKCEKCGMDLVEMPAVSGETEAAPAADAVATT